MKVTVLGSGTSTGVPIVGCGCKVCTSDDERNQRHRASILLEAEGQVLIDTGPDLRYQMLQHNVKSLTAVLYTHFHYDHLDGLPDLRPFTFDVQAELTCYANPQTHEVILSRYPYIRERAVYSNVPHLSLKIFPGNEEDGYDALQIASMSIRPIRLVHIPKAGVLSTGFVVNGKFGYLTDFKEINVQDEKFLYGLEVLYLGSPIDKPHMSHINHAEALALIEKYKPTKGFIGHLSHQYLHTELLEKWQGLAEPAYDGQQFRF